MVHTHELTGKKEATGGSSIFLALVPWILFTVVAEHGTLKLASIAALVLSLGICVRGVSEGGSPKSLELGALAAFAAFTIIAFAADPAVGAWVERYARGIAAGLLALIAFGSLATVPFTEQYARESVPRELWDSPRFKAVNRKLTLMWGTVFAAMVPFHVLAGELDTRATNLVLNWAVPIALVVWGIKRTSTITKSEEA